MASSETSICNSALAKLGEGDDGRISSLTDGSKNANFCAEQYAKLRDDLLRTHHWNFSVTRVELAQSSITPAFEYDYQYALPSDWIRTISVSANDAGTGHIPYKQEGQFILASTEQIFLRYVAQITDAAIMTADFREALATKIAHEGAIPIAQSNTLKQDMKDDLKRILRRARSTDAIEDFPEARPQGSWVTVRSRGVRRDLTGYVR